MSVDKRKALGRGLSALIPGAGSSGSSGGGGSSSGGVVKRDYFVCAIEDIHTSGDNPRKSFDDQAMQELIASIREHGILQPLVVRHRPPVDGGGFTLIAGERRWRAAGKAGLKDVPVVVKEATDLQSFELALVENLQRKDLNAIEEAEGYRRLCDDFGYTPDRLAERVGKDRSTIVNTMRLLKLPPPVRGMLAEGRLQSGHARALLGLDDATTIEKAAHEVERGGLSVRQTEAIVQRAKAAAAGKPKKIDDAPPTEIGKSPSVKDLERRLERALGMRARVVQKSTTAGQLQIEYDSLDQLDRLLDRLFTND